MIAAILWAALSAPAAALSLFGPSRSLESALRLFEAGKYSDVISDLSGDGLQTLRAADQRKGYLYLGMSYERLGEPDRALGIYQLGIKLYPRDINLLSQLAVLLHRMGLEERAQPLFARILAIHPNNALAHLGLAKIDHTLGLLDRSAAHYERALETMSDDAHVWRDYAELMLSMRDLKTADLAIRRALALSPQPETLFDLARVQRAGGRLDEALDTLKRVVERYPTRSDLSAVRSLWLLEAGRDAEALAGAEAAIKSGADEPLAYWVRARVNLKRDRYAAAVADLSLLASAERTTPFTAQAAKALLAQLGAAK